MNLKDKNVQNLLLGIIILMALIPLAWDKARPAPKSSSTTSVAGNPSDTTTSDKLRSLPPERTFHLGSANNFSSDLKSEIPLSDAPENIRARYVPMSMIDGEYYFHVKIYSEARCMQGDMDIIQKELRYTRKPRLLLSLENLGPSSGAFQSVTKVLEAGDLQAGASFTFKVPELLQAQHVGLFLCLDSAGANSCKNKPAYDLVDVANRYIKGRTKRLKNGKRIPDATDKIYFFHHFLIDRDRLIGFDTTIGEEDYVDAERYLEDIARDGGVTSEVLARAKYLNQRIRSMPAKIRKRNILVNLPREEQGKCAEAKILLPPSLKRAMERRGGRIIRRGS